MLKHLDNKLTNATMDIEDNVNDHLAYYMRGGCYFEKAILEADIVKKSKLYEAALEDYKKAIELDGTQAKYVIAKAKLLSVMGKEQECIEDLEIAKTLLPNSTNPLEKLYVNNTINNIEKLDSIKATLASLKEGKEGEELKLISAVENLADVTSNINLAVYDNKELIDANTNQITQLTEAVKALIEKGDKQAHAIEELLATVQKQGSIIIQQARDLAEQDSVLRDNKLYQKAKMKAEYNKLETVDIDKFNYAKSVSFGLINYLHTYAGDIDFYTKKTNKIALDVVGKVVKFVPVIGNTLDSIHDVVSQIYSQYNLLDKTIRKSKIKEIFRESFDNYYEDVSLLCLQAGLVMTERQSQKIQDVDSIIGSFTKLNNAVESKLYKLAGEILGVSTDGNVHNLNICSLALMDVELMIDEICKSSGDKLDMEQIEMFTDIVVGSKKGINEQEEEKESSQTNHGKHKHKCIVQAVHDIVYNNELLNNPEMLKTLFNRASNIYDINKILNLSSMVSDTLIMEAVKDHDVDLLLGGIMSMDYE